MFAENIGITDPEKVKDFEKLIYEHCKRDGLTEAYILGGLSNALAGAIVAAKIREALFRLK